MSFRLRILLQLLTFAWAAALLGCESSALLDMSPDDDDGDTPPTGLQVSPLGPLTMGFGEEQQFGVLLLDQEGRPMAGEPVLVSLVGPAHNAYVSPFEFTTDSAGEGTVVFTASEKATELEVRFSSPAAFADVSVQVSVSSSALGLAIDLDYSGDRVLTLFSTELHDGIACDQLGQAESPEPLTVQTVTDLPATLWFDGLLADHEYAALARGYNAEGTVRAAACVGSLSPQAASVELVIQDLPYTLAGVFAISALVETGGDLAPGVQALADGLEEFSADVPGAILDAIRQGLADSVAVDQFDVLREGQDLDGLLSQDFEERGVDLAADLDVIWNAVELRLAVVGMSTRLEIGAVTDGVHALYHTVQQLTFDGIDAPYPVVLQDQGSGTASIAAADPDLLEIAFHSVGLGLGGPLLYVTGVELEAGFGSAELDEVLTARVDCEAVTEVLAAPLVELADPVAIHAGCAAAMAAAEVALEDQGNLLDSACPQIGFAGSCRLADPGLGDQVENLTQGLLSVTWGGEEPLGPMAATFTGQVE